MKPYSPLKGVPRLSYYLEKIMCFGDMGIKEERKILFTSRNKQELIDLCLQNKWSCYECGNDHSGWYEYSIGYRL